jgi:hypothetical protein
MLQLPALQIHHELRSIAINKTDRFIGRDIAGIRTRGFSEMGQSLGLTPCMRRKDWSAIPAVSNTQVEGSGTAPALIGVFARFSSHLKDAVERLELFFRTLPAQKSNRNAG